MAVRLQLHEELAARRRRACATARPAPSRSPSSCPPPLAAEDGRGLDGARGLVALVAQAEAHDGGDVLGLARGAIPPPSRSRRRPPRARCGSGVLQAAATSRAARPERSSAHAGRFYADGAPRATRASGLLVRLLGGREPRRARRAAARCGTRPRWREAGGPCSSSTVPPWSSTKRRATARPRPVPFFLPRVTKGSKSRVADLVRHPRPLVATQDEHERIRRPRGCRRSGAIRPRPPIASRALAAMFEAARRSLSTSRAPRCAPRQVEVADDLEARAARRPGPRPAPGRTGRGEHGAPREPGAAAAGEVQGLGGHALEPVDAAHDELGRAPAPPRPEARVEQGLRVAADHRHGPAEVVGQHSRHGPEGRHALRGDQLPLVEVVLEGQGGAARRSREQPLTSAGRNGTSPAVPAAGPSTSMPTRPLRAIRGTRTPVARLLGVSTSVPVRDEVAGLGGVDLRPSPAERGAHLRLIQGEALEGVELAVPEQEGRPVHAKAAGRVAGQEAGRGPRRRGPRAPGRRGAAASGGGARPHACARS